MMRQRYNDPIVDACLSSLKDGWCLAKNPGFTFVSGQCLVVAGVDADTGMPTLEVIASDTELRHIVSVIHPVLDATHPVPIAVTCQAVYLMRGNIDPSKGERLGPDADFHGLKKSAYGQVVPLQKISGKAVDEESLVRGVWTGTQTANTHFAVRVWRDGGTTDGDSTQQCDRTYTVRTYEATTPTGGGALGEDMLPEWARPVTGPLVTGGGSAATSITAFADAGGGEVTVTAAYHSFENGDNCVITGTTNYDGSYTVSGVAGDDFDITATWVSDDASGTAYHAGRIGVGYRDINGDFHLWDANEALDTDACGS